MLVKLHVFLNEAMNWLNNEAQSFTEYYMLFEATILQQTTFEKQLQFFSTAVKSLIYRKKMG